MVRIRPATPDDADELARLRWDFRVEHGTPVSRTFDEFIEEFRTLRTTSSRAEHPGGRGSTRKSHRSRASSSASSGVAGRIRTIQAFTL